MKNLSIPALLLVGALALAGCTAGAESAPEAAPASPVAAEQVAAVKAPPAVDVKTAKAEAIAAGRPVAAWDKECVAWELPESSEKAQAWANKLGAEFLESRGAECPDQITMPHYYIESFEPGKPGELIVRVGPEMNRILGELGSGPYNYLSMVAEGVMNGIMDSNPEVKKVTALTPTGKKYGNTDRAKTTESRFEGGIL